MRLRYAPRDGNSKSREGTLYSGFLLQAVAAPREGQTEKDGPVDVTSLEELDYNACCPVKRDGLVSRVGLPWDWFLGP